MQLMRETIIFMEESSQSNRMGKLYCASPTADLGHSVNSTGILAITSLTGPQTLPKHHPVPGWVLEVGPQERLQGLCFPQETGSSSPGSHIWFHSTQSLFLSSFSAQRLHRASEGNVAPSRLPRSLGTG